jgi:hypothetical protein
MPNPGPVKVLDSLQGTSYVAIEAALKTLQRHRLDVTRRTIAVVRDGETTVVVLAGMEGRAGARVSPEAELSASEMEALAAAGDRATVLDSIEGSSLPAIRTAAEVCQRRVADLSAYRIALMSEGESLVVSFTDKDAAPGGRGSRGSRPGFEVEMRARDLEVRRSNFVR